MPIILLDQTDMLVFERAVVFFEVGIVLDSSTTRSIGVKIRITLVQ